MLKEEFAAQVIRRLFLCGHYNYNGMDEFINCEYCDHDSYNNRIFINTLSTDWYMDIKTSHWDEYNDDWDYERVHINYCPWCGRQLD